MRAHSTCLAVVLLATTLLPAQRTFVVQGNADAFRLALAQAIHGDVLLVRAGSYNAGVGTDQGIAILCDPGVLFLPFSTHGVGISVNSVPRGQTFRMRGGVIPRIGGLASKLSVTDNQGAVLFENVDVGFGVAVRRNAAVGFTGCWLPATRVEDSTVAFSNCSILGNACATPTAACAAVAALRSTVSISGGTTRGGEPLVILFGAGTALHVDASRVTIAGDSSTVIASGNGPIEAITTVSGRLDIEPSVTITAGGPQAITGNATVTMRRIPSIAAAGVLSGQTFAATSRSQVGSSTHMFASLPTAPLSTPFGSFWLAPNSLVLDSGITPSTGLRSVSFVLPPTFRGVPLVLQPITTLTTGQLAIGPATTIVLN